MKALEIAQNIIAVESMSLNCNPAMDLCQELLEKIGFNCEIFTSKTDDQKEHKNIIANIGSGPSICFAAHIDVVNVGERSLWKCDPFSASIIDDCLYGRGAVDMKGGLACFMAAAAEYLEKHNKFNHRISILITCDEEIGSAYGAKPLSEYLKKQGEQFKLVIVGEPTNPDQMGQVIKIGRRGLLDLDLIVKGKSGHTAYPHLADNAAAKLVKMLNLLPSELDQGTSEFIPSSLQISNIQIPNSARNVVPGLACASLNIRYNNFRSADQIIDYLSQIVAQVSEQFEFQIKANHQNFLTKPGLHSDLILSVLEEINSKKAILDTGGGISDARFYKDLGPTLEYGLVSATIHQVNEHARLKDLENLTRSYFKIIEKFAANYQ